MARGSCLPAALGCVALLGGRLLIALAEVLAGTRVGDLLKRGIRAAGNPHPFSPLLGRARVTY